MSDLDLAVIGNSSFGTLIDRHGRIVWSCMPRFDGDPVFCALLDGTLGNEAAGFYDIEIENFERAEQR